jgi:hypothetical protein
MKDPLIEELLKRAEKQAKELDYPLAVALGDILGGLVYDVNAYVSETRESSILETEAFQTRFAAHTLDFCENITAKR